LILSFDGPAWSGESCIAYARSEFPDATTVIVRLTDRKQTLEGFDDYLYYIELTGTPPRPPDDTRVRARWALSEDRTLVSDLLVEAFDDALRMRSQTAPEDAGRRQAEAVIDLPESKTLIAEVDGAAFGHVTLLDDQTDEVSDEKFIEFLDLFVIRTHPDRRAADALLVQRAHTYATEQGLNLVGHVVVREGGQGYEADIMDRVEQQGWSFRHKFVIADLD